MRTTKRRSRLIAGLLVGSGIAGLVASSATAETQSTEASGTTASSGSAAGGATLTPTYTPVTGPVRGFDGTTIKVAGIGIKERLPGSETGARARIQRFNDSNEIPGIKIEYTEMVDDKGDPAITLTEARRLVESVGIFAIVGNVSQSNPAYWVEQHVPSFGWAFDGTYCSPTKEPSLDVWNFGYYGCLLDSDPAVIADLGKALYTYVTSKGETNPSIASISTDSDSGKRSILNFAIADNAVGFRSVLSETGVPQTPVADWSPYVQKLMTADNGNPPTVIRCGMAIECLPLWGALQAAGYKGYYSSFLYSDLLVGPMAGSIGSISFAPFDTDNESTKQMIADFKAVAPDSAPDTGGAAGYFGADMLITALKIAKDNGGISPENVQQAAATMTWEIPGLVGPTRFPESFVKPTPLCAALVLSDGTKWNTVQPLSCSDASYPAK